MKKTFLVYSGLAAMAALAFVGGRRFGAHDTVASPQSTSNAAAAKGSAPGAESSALSPSAAQSVLRTLSEAEIEATDLNHVAATEMPADIAERHKEMREQIGKDLGNVSEDLKSKLVALNDRASAWQRNLSSRFESGEISHEEYMNRYHDEIMVQLGELHAMVNEDQYRALTGLQPGIDPYDYMTTGRGGARAESAEGEEEPLTPEQEVHDKPQKLGNEKGGT